MLVRHVKDWLVHERVQVDVFRRQKEHALNDLNIPGLGREVGLVSAANKQARCQEVGRSFDDM